MWLETAAIALLLTATLKIMANATISPALPGLQASFPETPQAASLTRFLVAAPSLSVVLIAPLAGIFVDRFGRSSLLMAGVALFALSGAAGAFLPGLFSILASRLALGVAVALIMTAQSALVGDLFEGPRRNAFMGLQTAAINFSGFVYIALAGWLAGLSPRLPFLIYALALLLLPLLLPVLRQEQRRGRPSVRDRPQGAIGRRNDWLGPALSIGLLGTATVAIFFLMPSQLPFYLDGNGLDGAAGTAFGLGALTLTGGCIAMMFRRISTFLGLAATFLLGFTVMGAGFAILAMNAAWSFILAGAALVGAGYALVQPALLLLALEKAPADRRGSVLGIVTTAIFLGQVVSPLALTPLIRSAGYDTVFLGAACILCAMGVFVSGLLKIRGTRDLRSDP
ncbi:MFS transporter [Roseibium sp. AS2]|uniref:MFS transporter n=1 Tax=Roseibium sp. AS2 TaxID=3135781 RepID=UPI00318013A7